MKKFLLAVFAVSAAVLLVTSCNHKKSKTKIESNAPETNTQTIDSFKFIVRNLEGHVAQLEADSATKLVVKNWMAYADYRNQNDELLWEKKDSDDAAFQRKGETDTASAQTYLNARSKSFTAFRSANPDIYGKWADAEMLSKYGNEENETEGFDLTREQIDSSKEYADFKRTDAEAYTVKLAADSISGVTYNADTANVHTKYEEQRQKIWQDFLLKNN